MSRDMRWLLLALAAAPILAYYAYRLARGLGFLDPPWNREHEERRTIVVAMYAFLLSLSIFLFGHGNSWPRVWVYFGIVNALALLFFGALGVAAGRRLWKLRRLPPEVAPPAAPPEAADESAGKPPI